MQPSSIDAERTAFSTQQNIDDSPRQQGLFQHSNPHSYPEPPHFSPPAGYDTAYRHHDGNSPSTPSDVKGRLRKACDSCSVRKVKCDESGPPCRSCAALDIPCTFSRPSRRRGPPNKHAEAIKRRRLEEGEPYSSAASSPTHDPALGLPSPPAPSQLSAESICAIPTLRLLIDDYFTYIHPLIPLPHEPTFRAAFARREDRTNHSFLALLAAMIEILVASFPRRPRQLFTSEKARKQFPNAGALIDQCHQVFIDARGLGFLDKDLTLYDATGSYLAALAAGYLFDTKRLRLYFGECIMIVRLLGIHKLPDSLSHSDSADTPIFAAAKPVPETDYIAQEFGRRLFWLCFVGCLSMRQLGSTDGDLLMPPTTHAEKFPPMPLEVDDAYIFKTHIIPQPPDVLSEITGFNLNVKVFRSYYPLSALEIVFGIDEVYDWERQKRLIGQSLANVKTVTNNVPHELQLHPRDQPAMWPSPVKHFSSDDRQDFNAEGNAYHEPTSPAAFQHSKRKAQYEIQKANIYASQLGTRSYLVERYWNMYEIRERDSPYSGNGLGTSPSISCVAAGVDARFQPDAQYYQQATSQSVHGPSLSIDVNEQTMGAEREKIVRDLAILLQSINQINMEPNGLSFCHKIRLIASTLLDNPGSPAAMPSLDAQSVNAYLFGFVEILMRLERLGSSSIRRDMSSNYGLGEDGVGHGPLDEEEIEERELVQWASLKQHQEKFVRENGFVAGM